MSDAAGPARRSRGTAVEELRAVSDVIGSAVVDGVPVLFAPGDGRVSGGLVFRVGWADEPLARRGITHLVEHLALFDQHDSDVHLNGATDEWSTQFHATGSAAEVVTFLNRVCVALREPPLHRMEVEKGVLAAEAARRSAPLGDRLRIERYGVRGPGTAGYDNFGLSALSEGDLRAWMDAWFTRGNAVAWITLDAVPDGLDLRLTDGPRRPIPELPACPARTPAFFDGPPGVVLLDAVIPATAAGAVFSQVASRALFRALRQEGGMSYEARCDWQRLDAERARVSVYADVLREKQAEAVGEIVDVIAALRAGRIRPEDLDAAHAAVDELRSTPFLGASMLPSTAYKLAAGVEIRSTKERAEEFSAVTADDVAEAASQVYANAIAQIPEGRLDWAGFTRAPEWSESAVSGRTYPRSGSDVGALTIGDEGVSVHGAGGVVTVTFAETEALETWPDGARRLFGADGFQVGVEPTLHPGVTADVIAAIDASIPAERHVARPPRAPEEIPHPPAEEPATAVAGRPSRPDAARRGWMFYAGLVAGAIAVGLALLVIGDLLAPLLSPGDDTVDADALLGGVLLTAVPALLAAVLLLADSRRRAKRSGAAG